jgi:hypothetical protein
MAVHKNIEGRIKAKMIVGDIINLCPEAEEVFKKHFGPNSLLFPGAKTESVEFLAAMNDCHQALVLKDLNDVCEYVDVSLKNEHFEA